MVYRGKVQNGVVVFEGDARPPEGTEVSIDPVKEEASQDVLAMRKLFMDFAGVVDDLPPDFARNHDHYIHGAPKR